VRSISETFQGLTSIASRLGPEETMKRLETELRGHGMTVFARIDHAAGAAEAGMKLRPTKLLIFGNTSSGTPLMQSTQTIGIDLPLKMLVWEDALGETWLSYNEPNWIAQRHNLPNAEGLVSKMTAALRSIVRETVEP
jgi:uncharacterized protein (DUF302 family)